MMIMMLMLMMMMMMMMMIVKNTPAHVHDLYSCWYNMSVYSVYISWSDTFGLHTWPLSDTVKIRVNGLQLLSYRERSCTLDFNMVAEQ